MIEDLHFLRPLWLLALPLTAVAWWLVRRRESAFRQLGDVVAPHLRDALTINRNAHDGVRAVDGVALVMLIIAAAAAGPTFSQQRSPWFEDNAPLIIAIEVSDSMRANDVMPSRLDRARFKVLDLVAARSGARTALIAYAGSAYIVMPPTSDSSVLKTFLEGLDPAVMPEPGADAAAALALADRLISDDRIPGTLLFVNDGFASEEIDAIRSFASVPGAPSLLTLVVGTAAGGVAATPDGFPVLDSAGVPLDTRVDEAALRRVAAGGDMRIVRSSAGDGDVRTLIRAIESSLSVADDPEAEWLDQGWWLLWFAMLGSLAWFRRGWTMQW